MTTEKDGLGDDGIFRWHRKGPFMDGLRMQCLPKKDMTFAPSFAEQPELQHGEMVVDTRITQEDAKAILGAFGEST